MKSSGFDEAGIGCSMNSMCRLPRAIRVAQRLFFRRPRFVASTRTFSPAQPRATPPGFVGRWWLPTFSFRSGKPRRRDFLRMISGRFNAMLKEVTCRPSVKPSFQMIVNRLVQSSSEPSQRARFTAVFAA